MKRTISSAVVGVAVLALGLTGCDPHPPYSANVKYGLRKDPILRAAAAKDLADDRYDPDRPGVLPIMHLSDIQKPDHPFHAKAAVIDDKILRDPTMAPADKQKELDEALRGVFGTPAAPTINLKDLTIHDIANREEKLDLKGLGKKSETTKKLEKILAEIQADANLSDQKIAEGSTRYRVHCLHCHGVTGDGRGPTARWVNPHPRDFRAGMFKFQSVDQSGGAMPPARHDLLRTLQKGIEGTAMPTFNLLKEEELEALISYVTHLSIRGNSEMNILVESFSFDKGAGTLVWQPDPSRPTMLENVKYYAGQHARAWRDSNQSGTAIKPVDAKDFEQMSFAEQKASVLRGQQMFTGLATPAFKKEFFARNFDTALAGANNAAISSAIKTAEDKAIEAAADKMIEAAKAKLKSQKKELSDDEENRLREEFEKEYPRIREALKGEHERIRAVVAKGFPALEEQTRKKVEAKAETMLVKCVSCHTDYGRQAKYKVDDWATLVRPNNFTQGVFRGGRRPVDIYFRVHSGITGSAMTPFAKTFEGNEHYIWDLVNFVRVLPYPLMRERLGVKLD